MGSSTKINSIAINLTDANNDTGMEAGDGFSLGCFIAEIREIDPIIFWPYSKESARLVDQQSGSLTVPKLRWWPRLSSTRNIDADGTNDSGLPSTSTSIIRMIGPSGSQMTSPTAIDQENERNTDIAGNAVVVYEDVNCERPQNDDQRENAVVENEDINCERSHNDDQTGNTDVVNGDVNCQRSQQQDQTGNAVVENGDVNCERSQNDDQRGKAVVENEDVNCERPQKDDQRVTRSSKKVHPPPLKTYSLRNKNKKLTLAEPVGNKRAEKPNVEQLAVTEIASCVEDTQPKASESISLFTSGAPSCSKTRKVRLMRRLNDLNDKPVINTRKEETSSQKEALRGSKRKAPPGSREVSTAGAVPENASKNVDAEHGGSEPTDSGFDMDPIKGKKKNVRFQVDDELVQEAVPENHVDPYPLMAKRTMKVRKSKKRRTNASSSVQPSLTEKETVPSPPRDQRTEERVGTSLEDQLASEGYVRKPNPQVNERQENNGMRSREVVGSYVPVFGNPSIRNTGRGLGTRPGAIYFGSSNNNNNPRTTTPSTVVAAQSSVQHKDASVSDRKGKRVMVQSHDESENTQNQYLPDTSNNVPQEVPQKPKTPFPFDLNETYVDVPSPEDNTNGEREEDSLSIRSEQNSVEPFPPRQTYMPSPSLMPPPVQESRRSSILFPGHNPQWMGNVPMATHHHHHHHHHPSPSPYQAMRVPHQYREPSPPVWESSMIPPQYHHLSPAPFNMDYSSMLAQAPRSDTWNISYYGANLMDQAMMSRMDPRFRSNTPVDHHGNIVFTPPRHVHPVNQFSPPVNQFNQVVELQRSHERPLLPRIRNQGRFQRPLNSLTAQRRNAASSSNASASRADNSYDSSECIISRNPVEISDIEPWNVYMVPEHALHVAERMAEFEKAENQVGPVTESG